MAIPITVPRLGWSMDEGAFVEWLKRDGDTIAVGDALFVLESEKAAENIEAIDAGVLRIPRDSPAPGATVKVGQVLAFLAAPGESVPEKILEPAPASIRASEPLATRGAGGSPARVMPAQEHSPAAPRCHAVTPRARRAARELNVDVRTLAGTGRGGRIRERDVRGAALPGKLIPHTPLRRTIAARMVAGVTQAAPVTLTTKIDATQLVDLIRKSKSAPTTGPSYTDLLLMLTAAALKQHPLLQAEWRDDGLFLPDAVDIALAVDTEAGLFAPVVRQVDRLSLADIASQTRDLIAAARAGKLTAEHLRGATFTITNLGMFGIDAFTPIIHVPQGAVLGMGRIVKEPAVVGDQVVPRDMMTLSLTFDHRVVDGAPAARFLNTLRQLIAACGT